MTRARCSPTKQVIEVKNSAPNLRSAVIFLDANVRRHGGHHDLRRGRMPCRVRSWRPWMSSLSKLARTRGIASRRVRHYPGLRLARRRGPGRWRRARRVAPHAEMAHAIGHRPQSTAKGWNVKAGEDWNGRPARPAMGTTFAGASCTSTSALSCSVKLPGCRCA
jgi:hypothetical protein